MLSGLNTNLYKENRQPSFTRTVIPLSKPRPSTFVKVFGNEKLSKTLDFIKSNLIIEVLGLDLLTMVIPRTIIAAGQNKDYAVETFGREILPEPFNPLGPTIVSSVMLGAAGLQGVTAGKKTIDNFYDAWKKSGGNNYIVDAKDAADKLKQKSVLTEFNKKTLSSITGDLGDTREIKGLSEKKLNSLAEEAAQLTLDNKDKKTTDKAIKKLAERFVKSTGAENNLTLKMKHKLNTDAVSLFNDMVHIPQKVFTKHAPGTDLDKAVNNLFNFVDKKSIAAMAFSLAGVVALPFITNWITKMRTGSDAYCAYADFRSIKTSPEEGKKKKDGLWKLKALGVAGMGLIVTATTGGFRKTTGFFGKGGLTNLKNALSPRGPHATLNMLKFIYGTNIAFRIIASRDKEEVKTTVLRDYASFFNWLVLGGVVAKGIAHALDPKGKSFVNITGPIKGKTPFHTALNWLKNVSQKTNKEVAAMAIHMKLDKNKRMFNKAALNAATLGGLAWSLISLGVAMPLLNNYMANQARKKQLAQANRAGFDCQKPASLGLKDSLNSSTTDVYGNFYARRKKYSHV